MSHPATNVGRTAVFLLVLACAAVSLPGCGGSSRGPDESAASGRAAEERGETGQRQGSGSEVSPEIRFADATAEAGLDGFRHRTGAFGEKWMPETMGGAVGVLDYDGDGDLDVVLSGGGALPGRSEPDVPALRLFENRGDGTFSERTEAAGLGDLRAYPMGLAAGDYDGDGDTDLYVTTLGSNLLLRNEEDGTFTDVTDEAEVAAADRWSTAAAFFDGDGDGDVDLYVGSYVRWSPEEDQDCTLGDGILAYCTPRVYEGRGSRYYRNDGDGTFTDRTEAAGFADAPGKTLGVVTLDYDRDGQTDLAVANDEMRNLLYRNDGDGTFTEVGRPAGIAFASDGATRAGMGIDAGVIDSTGRVSIAVGNFTDEMIGLMSYEGDGLFGHRSRRARIGYPSLRTLTFGLFFFDVDGDRDLDLFAANGHLQAEIGRVRDDVTYRQRPQLFRNEGGGTFAEVSASPGSALGDSLGARGATYGDLDGDGDLDVLLVENGGPVHLWENRTGEPDDRPGFLSVETAPAGSAPTVGTRIRAWVDGRQMERTVRGGGSYFSILPSAATFGLGDAEAVDSLRVEWPSGVVARRGRTRGGQSVRVLPESSRPLP